MFIAGQGFKLSLLKDELNIILTTFEMTAIAKLYKLTDSF